MPYILWQIIDFFKQSLYIQEYTFLKRLFAFFFLVVFILNLFYLFFIFPQIWLVFNSFNNNTFIDLLFELKINEYFLFIFNFLFFFNLFLMFLSFFLFLIYLLGIKLIIKWKKLFILCNVVFATLLSPPDVYSQILFLFILTIFFEIFLFGFILYLKYKTSKVAY